MQIEEKISLMVAYAHLAVFMLAGLVGCNVIPTFDTQQPLINVEHAQHSSAVPAARDFDFGDSPGTGTGFAAVR
ncbi:MAG: hypothetical protein ACRCV9_13810 [Burkholderiaceae bacterium]